MKKLAVHKPDVTSLISNLLLVTAVVAAAAPLLLGDGLVLLASNVVGEGSTLLQELSLSLQRLLS
jgi:hypothetical protein